MATPRGAGGWHKASVSGCLPLAAPIGLSPLHILTLCGSERVLVVSTEPPDDLSCLTTPGVGRPGDGAVARAVDRVQGGAGGYRRDLAQQTVPSVAAVCSGPRPCFWGSCFALLACAFPLCRCRFLHLDPLRRGRPVGGHCSRK